MSLQHKIFANLKVKKNPKKRQKQTLGDTQITYNICWNQLLYARKNYKYI